MSYLKLLYRRRTRLTYWIEEVKKTLSPVTAHSYNGLIKHLLLYEERWGIKDPRLSHIGLNYCQGFARYLAQADNARTQIPRPLSINTQKKLLIQLETILNKAVRSGLLPSNPCSELDFSFKKTLPKRHYLTHEEIQRLQHTRCRNEIIKNAFLFSCFCGLRWSDIKSLEWEDIQAYGPRWAISKQMVKTGEWVFLPLSESAQSFLPPKNNCGIVFSLPTPAWVNAVIREWALLAGIQKKVTFHTARHSFATLLLTVGADIYTTSKLLGHTRLSTTQIYAQIMDEKKRRTVMLLDELL